MHKVASCFVARSNSVRKTRPLEITGDDSPDPTGVFQRTFWFGSNSTGGLPSPLPEEFVALNCGQSAAHAKLDSTTVAATIIQGARDMAITLRGLYRHDCTGLPALAARPRLLICIPIVEHQTHGEHVGLGQRVL